MTGVAKKSACEAQRRLLTAVVESTHDAVLTTDRKGVITSWNSGAERLYGIGAHEMIGGSVLGDERARGWLARVLDGDDVSESAVPRQRRNGEEIWVSVTAAPLRERDGAISGMAVIAREVTDQQQLLAQLAQAEERQRLLLASLPGTLVALYDRELRCQMLDGQMVRRTGLDPADYVGKPISETLAPEQYEALKPLIERALDGESSSVEWTSALSGINYELDVAPYRLPDGTIGGAFAVGRDLTERLDRNAQLRERERQLAEAQAVAHLGSWELDVAANELTWSDELCRIAGVPLGSAPSIEEFLATMVHPEDRELLAGEIGDAIEGSGSSSEYRLIRPDGTVRHVRTTRDPRLSEEGQVTHLFGATQDITARVDDDRRLRKLAAVVEQTGEAITAKDADGNITEWNAGAETVYGYSAQEMMGQPVSRLIPPERAGEEFELLGRALAGETISQFHTERLRRDGSRLEVSITVSPVRDHQGKPVGASIITRDITARRAADRARKHALARMAEAQRIARVGSWAWDMNDGTASWSAEMYRLFARDPILGPAVGEQLFAYIHPHDLERVRAQYGKPLADGASGEIDYRIVAGDGAERVLNVHRRMEHPGYLVGTVQDVTDLRAIEREARESAELFRQTLEHAPIGIALVSPDGRWLNANRALCTIVGYSEAELLERSFQDITHPDDLDADLAQLQQTLAGEISGYHMEKRYFHKSGRVVQAELSVSLVRDEHGDPVHFISQIQDVTAQREAHEALAESERRYHSIAANVPGMVYRFAMDPQGAPSLRFASAGSRDLYGLEPEAVMADPMLIIDHVHPDDRAWWEASVAESATNLSLWEWSGRHLTPDGVTYCRAVAQPFREADGTVVWDGLVSDETAVRLAQAEEAQIKQRLQTILENLAGSAVTVYDRDHRLQFCEGPLFIDSGFEELYGRPLVEIARPETQALLAPGIERALEGETSSGILDSDSRGRSLAVHFAPYRAADGSIDGALVHWHDITAVRRAERERDEALVRFQVAFERAPIGMAILGLNGRFERVNSSICEISGRGFEEFAAMAPFEVVDPADRERIRGEFARLGAETDTLTFEHRITHGEGHPIWIQARVTLIRGDDGRPVHALAQVIDLTERRAYEKRLKQLADHDPLTGLLNRRGFETALETHLARCRRHGATGALLALDLDGFKTVNDTLGHGAGDDLIVSCGHALKRRLRETDTVARLGGDEFAVLLTDQGEHEAEIVARALVETVRECTSAIANSHPGRVTVSVGVAVFPNPVCSADEMLIQADRAMYDAKQGGRDRYALYGAERHGGPQLAEHTA